MSRPAVSIVVPTYKSVAYLRRMIESVIAQTFDDWELIIVDGASDDGTAELIAGYQPTLADRLVFIEQPNQGCSVARNTGIETARGSFIALLDSDDEYLPRRLERQMELFSLQPDLGLVYCDYSHIDFDGVLHRSTFDELATLAREVPYERVAPGLHVCTPDLFDYLVRGYFIATIVGLVRREVLADDIRFLPRDMYGCEWFFYLQIVRRCRAGYVDEPLCLHHFVQGSISRTSTVRNSVYHRSLLRIMRSEFADASPRAKAAIRRQLADTCKQLGFHGAQHAEFGAAIGYFAEALRERFEWQTVWHLLQMCARRVAALGHPGTEPLLRTDPHQHRLRTST